MNEPAATDRARHKPWQLRLATADSRSRRVLYGRRVAVVDQVHGRYGNNPHPWQPVETPEHALRTVAVSMGRAQLAYAASDFAENFDGIWWYLEERKQGGQFGLVEPETEQPIADAVAVWHSREVA
ncbi:hypothetical protein [Streptomyces sp. NPDC020681]|uniref:hypothetical protein n=1 Tax=Streptomyces sp. NPDC020681 TaxID=3365083 RepID=UPI0037909690